jgi:hypothetical protein
MNTTYKDINSPNNIHSVTCTSCHEQRARSKENGK